MNIAMVDLLTQTPFYDRYLSEALAPLVEGFTLYASRFQYELDYFDRAPFRRSPGLIDWVSGLQLKNRPVRQAGKMIEYGLNWTSLLLQFRRRRPDLVHIQWLPLLSRMEWELKVVERLRRLGIPVVYTVHNVLPHEESRRHREIYRRAYAAMDFLIVHTQADRERLVSDLDVVPGKIAVIPQGPVFGERVGYDREQARRALGLAADDQIFLMMGVIRPYKGLAETVQALSGVLKTWPECRLLVVGQALDQGYFRRVQALASELGIEPHIQWHTEYVHSSKVALFHLAADVVLFPYHNISQSAAFLTAAALGSCTLTTRVGGLAELVQAGEMGVQIETADPAAIADGLHRLLMLSPAERARMGEAVRLYVQDQCNWHSIAQKTVDAYRRLASG